MSDLPPIDFTYRSYRVTAYLAIDGDTGCRHFDWFVRKVGEDLPIDNGTRFLRSTATPAVTTMASSTSASTSQLCNSLLHKRTIPILQRPLQNLRRHQ